MKNPLPGKPVPTVYQHTIKIEWFRKLTWRERFAILFGCNFLVQLAIHTEHNPAKYQPVIRGIVTKELSARDRLQQLAEDSIEARKPKYELVKNAKPDPTKA